MGRDSRSAFFHPPDREGPRKAAVVICAPWGWDEVTCYRSRKRWAERLAAAGHPALRFDFPAAGDSAGEPTDPGLVDSWLETIAAAASWLDRRPEVPSVALLGLGLGGLLAREAVAREAPVQTLITWGAPASGRDFVREARVFSRLQEWNEGKEVEEAGGPGAIEAGGFLISAETKAALSALDPAPGPASKLQRALLLERDGVAPSSAWVEGLTAAGVEVQVAPGEGWGLLVSHPERSRLPDAAANEVERWLARSENGVEPATAPADPAPTATAGGGESSDGDGLEFLDLPGVDGNVRESAWAAELPFGRAFGVLAEPAGSASDDRCAVFLNAGAVRHTGPNRLWVEAARRAARGGIRSLRVDLEAIGESAGDETKFSDVAEFYVPGYAEQVRAILDALEQRGAKRFVLIGLCAGAYWSFQAAQQDPRIESVLLLNSGALVWHPDLVVDRAVRDLDRFRNPEWWRELLAGGHRPQGIFVLAGVLWNKVGQLLRRIAGGWRKTPQDAATVDSQLDRLGELGTRVTLAFSAGEALRNELEVDGVLERLGRWPNVDLQTLPGADHSLRPFEAQRVAAELIDDRIAALPKTAASATSVPGPSSP